jgi:hypothetical protein
MTAAMPGRIFYSPPPAKPEHTMMGADRVRDPMRVAGPTDPSALTRGETGAGKGLIASHVNHPDKSGWLQWRS